jgi:hypothetical protein
MNANLVNHGPLAGLFHRVLAYLQETIHDHRTDTC